MDYILYLSLIFLGSLIASSGLITNSVAVVIGSMLISPFLDPIKKIISKDKIISGFILLFGGVFISIIVGMFFGYLQNPPENHEMISRADWKKEPSVRTHSILIAVFAGLTLAISERRKDIINLSGIGTAVAGIGVAAAWLPPLVNGGLFLGKYLRELNSAKKTHYYQRASDSIELGLINIVFITLTYAIGLNIFTQKHTNLKEKNNVLVKVEQLLNKHIKNSQK